MISVVVAAVLAGGADFGAFDEQAARMRKLTPPQVVKALLDRELRFNASLRLVELKGASVAPLLAQFRGPRCKEPFADVREEDLTPEQLDEQFLATECEAATAEALLAVVCAERSLSGRLSKELDARLFKWLPLEKCSSDEVLTALAPRAMSLARKVKDPGEWLGNLAPFGPRAVEALPWALAALEARTHELGALMLVTGVGRDAHAALPHAARLLDSTNDTSSTRAQAAVRAIVAIGTADEAADVFEAWLRRSDCNGLLRQSEVLSAWQELGGAPERLHAAGEALLHRCPGQLVELARVMGRAKAPFVAPMLLDEKLPILDRALLLEALSSVELTPPQKAQAERLSSKIWPGGHRASPQVMRFSEPTGFAVDDVNQCRAEAGLAPVLEWPFPSGKREEAEERRAAALNACLRSRWCGPEKSRFVKTVSECCAAFGASAPAWCDVRSLVP